MAARLTARQKMDRSVSERDLMNSFMDAARLMGWDVMHVTDSRKMVNHGGKMVLVGDPDCKGWPDLFMAHARTGRLVAIEVKVEDPNRGRVTAEQEHWLKVLSACGVECMILRPSTWDECMARLRRRAAAVA